MGHKEHTTERTIAIDATSLMRKRTGIENYAYQLVKNVLQDERIQDKCVVIFRNRIPPELATYVSDSNAVVIRSRSQVWCEQVRIPLLVLKLRIQYIHFPAFPPGFLVPKKKILVTIHDATPWLFPDTMKFKSRLYFRTLYSRLKQRVRITVNSVSTKNDLSSVGFNPALIKVIHHAFNGELFSVEDDVLKVEEIKVKYGLTAGQFILFVGTMEKRKNLIFSLKSLYELVFVRNINVKLVIVGRIGWKNDEYDEYIKSHELSEHVMWLGYVPDAELPYIYRLATVFLFPSLYEGFGVPLLEAMASRLPVFASNVPALKEIGGDYVMYGRTVSSFVEWYLETLRARFCASNLEKLERAKQHAATFTWNNTATDTITWFLGRG